MTLCFRSEPHKTRRVRVVDPHSCHTVRFASVAPVDTLTNGVDYG